MKLREVPQKNRPRERLLHHGDSVLSDAELLAVILQQGSCEHNVVDMCQRILSAWPPSRLPRATSRDLSRIPGIGTAKALQIQAACALAQRIKQEEHTGKPLSSPRAVHAYISPKLAFLKQEHFYALLLDSQHMLLREELVAIGTLNALIVHPREVFRTAIKENAYAVIIVHNHPSGNPEPSGEDGRITRQLYQAGEVLGIELLDHVVIGNHRFYSFREEGELHQ